MRAASLAGSGTGSEGVWLPQAAGGPVEEELRFVIAGDDAEVFLARGGEVFLGFDVGEHHADAEFLAVGFHFQRGGGGRFPD